MSLPEVQDTGNLMNEFQGYDQSHEDFFRSLPGDHRRRYAAVEALKIGFGGSALAVSRMRECWG